MNISVLGDGAWGTTLAMLLADNGHDVLLWGAFQENVDAMREERCNRKFLGDFPFPERLQVTSDEAEATVAAELLVLGIPTQFLRKGLTRFQECPPAKSAILVDVAKGIECETLLRPSEIVAQVWGRDDCTVLSGPSHAEEVVRRIPTAVTVGCENADLARTIQAVFMTESFRVYTVSDCIGVELGGALKNVFAVAAGICDGMGLGDNSKAALLTRGIAEMARFGSRLGGAPETFAGLSGVGDMIVTCTSHHSRNRHVGEELGRGKTLDQIQAEMGMVVAEGVRTAASAYQLARKLDVETPIIDEVHAVLYEDKPAASAVSDLMNRRPTSEDPVGSDPVVS
jgi:glycerol-3-phosphate dehydrogenase (NAD(P)+)